MSWIHSDDSWDGNDDELDQSCWNQKNLSLSQNDGGKDYDGDGELDQNCWRHHGRDDKDHSPKNLLKICNVYVNKIFKMHLDVYVL